MLFVSHSNCFPATFAMNLWQNVLVCVINRDFKTYIIVISTINIKHKLVKWNIWTDLVMILHSSMYVKWSTSAWDLKNYHLITKIFLKNLYKNYVIKVFFFFKVDVVMICTCFIIASSLTLIFCLSLLFWVLKIASSLVFFLRIFIFLLDVGKHTVLDFHSPFVSVGMSVRDHIILHFSFAFILMDVGNLIALDSDLLFVFVLGTSKWRK